MNGIIVIDKPKDYTSRDVVNIIGKKFKTKKVGHTGTLDPMATGVLIICLNKATKIVELLTSEDKEYIAEFTLGLLTDTLDITGTVLKEEESNFSKEKIEQTLKEFVGKYEQEVPIYSAVKVNGRKLYEYARNNEYIDLPKHLVEIKNIELLDIKKQDGHTTIKIKCLVSKGTYIRALGNDIAKKLNTVATMISLRRTKQGNFTLDKSYKLEEVLNDNYQLLDIESSLNYPKIEVDDILKEKISNGAIIDNIYNQDLILFTYKHKILALYKKYDQDLTKLKPWKMLI